MGSPFNIVIYSTDSLKAAEAASEAFKLIDTLNRAYSDYLPESELNALCEKSNVGKWVPVSEPLFSVLEKAWTAGKRSGGAFDITAGPLIKLWRRARLEKRLPDQDSINAAKKLVSYKSIELDHACRCVRLIKPGIRLDLGGIAKGETAQRSYERLRNLGCAYALVDAGGDIVAGELPIGIDNWKIAINLPETGELMSDRLSLHNKAVATSGDLYQYLEINGERYSHIIDPVSGYAVKGSRNVTVIAADGADADWLATACSILPVRKALKLVEKKPSAEVLIAVLKGNKTYFYHSTGFATYFK